MSQAFSRRYVIDCCANGSLHIRRRGQRMPQGLLPVFSTDTEEEAKTLRVRHCKLARDGSDLYHLNERPKGIEDLPNVTATLRATYEEMQARRKYYEAYIGADLFGTPQAPTKTEVIFSDGRQFPTFYHLSGAKVIVPVQLEREIARP